MSCSQEALTAVEVAKWHEKELTGDGNCHLVSYWWSQTVKTGPSEFLESSDDQDLIMSQLANLQLNKLLRRQVWRKANAYYRSHLKGMLFQKNKNKWILNSHTHGIWNSHTHGWMKNRLNSGSARIEGFVLFNSNDFVPLILLYYIHVKLENAHGIGI